MRRTGAARTDHHMDEWNLQRPPLPDALPPPQGDDVHVWLFELDRAAVAMHALGVDEQRRAARFVRDADRRRYLDAHARMRVVLGAYCGIEPARLRFAAGAHGKPRLEPAALHFNLSHSADRALLAVGSSAEIGVDIEAWREVDDELARTFLSSEEHALVQASGRPDAATLLGCWTRKEAYLKAVGCGLLRDPREVRAGCAPTPLEVDGIVLRSLPLPDGYSGALAVRGRCGAVRLYRLAETLH